jgi:DNA-binding transcriptional LysR family regulator
MATVHRLQREHPDVDIQVVQAGARRVLQLVTDDEVDLGITPVTARARSSVRFEPLISAPLALICPVGHPLAGAQVAEPADLVDEPIVDLPRGWWARDAFDRMFAARDLFRRSRLECDDPLAVLRTVRDSAALGYGLAAEVDSGAFPEIASTRLAGAPSCEIGLVTRRGAGRRQPVAAFLDAYRDRCERARLGDDAALAPSAGAVPLLSIA